MKCPVDKSDMMVVEHRRIELDYCLKCAGVWFDSGELDLLIAAFRAEGATLAGDELLTPQKAKTSEAARKCPICGRKMDKVWLGKSPRVLIDSCPQGDGLWFDGGELAQVIHQVEPAGSKEILGFLGDALRGGHQHKTDK